MTLGHVTLQSPVPIDLQLRRATRQESTKKYSSTGKFYVFWSIYSTFYFSFSEKSFDAEESNLMSTTSTSDSGISVSDVSSVSQSLLEEEEVLIDLTIQKLFTLFQSPRFKRKLAYRRKKLHTSE